MYQQFRINYQSIDNIQHVENLLNSETPSDPKTIIRILEKGQYFCAEKVKAFLNMVRPCSVENDGTSRIPKVLKYFLGMDSNTWDRKYQKIWELKKNEVLIELKKEKIKAANDSVYQQAILSSVLIAVELRVLYSVWEDVTNARNVLRRCREHRIPLIQDRIEDLRKDEAELKRNMEEYISESNPQLFTKMRILTSSMSRKLNTTRNMIGDLT